MSERLACFKAYDVRGKVPSELDPKLAERIGRALADETGASNAVVGFDVRLSSREIADGLISGLRHAGVNVTDIGLCGTEMVYFATAKYGFGAGVMVTASHNPPEYNGMKFVREESKPISGDSGLWEVERRARENDFVRSGNGTVESRDVYADFADHLLNIVPPSTLKPLRVLANPGNGCAGLAIHAFRNRIPLEIVEMDFEPNGNFPNGVPNPILEESRAPMVERMKKEKFDFGVAWDGDYDRCFFFDENGGFVEGYYIVGLLAQDLLTDNPGAKIIHDPRLSWNTIEIVNRMGGIPVLCKTGHAFIKERMRKEGAVYGGEMSAHHYFRSHWFCDSGMIPFLQIARLVSRTGKSLGELVSGMQDKFPCSGEINSVVKDPKGAIEKVEAHFAGGVIDRIDGLSMEFPEWRFNLRSSNTEPILRLNVETRGDKQLVWKKVEEILSLVRD